MSGGDGGARDALGAEVAPPNSWWSPRRVQEKRKTLHTLLQVPEALRPCVLQLRSAVTESLALLPKQNNVCSGAGVRWVENSSMSQLNPVRRRRGAANRHLEVLAGKAGEFHRQCRWILVQMEAFDGKLTTAQATLVTAEDDPTLGS